VRQKWCTESLQIIIDRYGDDEFLELVEEVCSLEESQWEGWYIKRSAAIISERGDCFRDWMVQWKKRKIRFLSVDEEWKEFRGTLLGMFVEERKATDVYGQVMIGQGALSAKQGMSNQQWLGFGMEKGFHLWFSRR
jgi:hypothetical protein